MKHIVLAALLATAGPACAASYDNLNAGIQLYNLHEWNAAIQQFDLALAANDLVPSLQFIAHFDRGQSHGALSHYDLAIADYSASLALRPNEVQVLISRALLYGRNGKMEQAMTDLDATIAARPDLDFAYAMRSVANMRLGRIDKGREDIKIALSLRSENAAHGRDIGIANWEVGELEKAEDEFSYEVEHGPRKDYGWIWYALTETRMGKALPRRSLPDFDKKVWPAPIIGFFLGDITREAVFATAQQGEANAVNGQICEANFYVGEWLLHNHDPAGAKPLIGEAASNCPTNFVEWGPAQMDVVGLP